MHERQLRRLFRSQWAARAREVLVETALVEVALGRRPELLGSDYPLEFGTAPVLNLRRHGYPFAPLLRLVGNDELAARPEDPRWEELSRLSTEQLKAHWRRLREEAEKLVHQLADERDE